MKKVIQNYEDCIGCGTCVALCPKFWEMGDEGKARPKLGEKTEKGIYEFEIDEKKLSCNKDAAEACPVQVIKIV